MQTRFKNVFDCIEAPSATDFTADLGKFDVPTLILHGDADQIVPIGASAPLRRSSSGRRSEGLQGRRMAETHRDQLNRGELSRRYEGECFWR
jgi:non-heme chloroperoxidase